MSREQEFARAMAESRAEENKILSLCLGGFSPDTGVLDDAVCRVWCWVGLSEGRGAAVGGKEACAI